MAGPTAIRALELDPNLADAHTSLAEVFKDYDWNWALAERHYRHALTLKPGYATAHQWYTQLLVTLGRYPEAVCHIEQARRADPVSPAINTYVPYVFLAGRNYDRALREARRAVSLEPYSPLAHWQLGRAYLFSDQSQHAVASLDHAAALRRVSIDVARGALLCVPRGLVIVLQRQGCSRDWSIVPSMTVSRRTISRSRFQVSEIVSQRCSTSSGRPTSASCGFSAWVIPSSMILFVRTHGSRA